MQRADIPSAHRFPNGRQLTPLATPSPSRKTTICNARSRASEAGLHLGHESFKITLQAHLTPFSLL